jgi:hypothetical protein
MTTTPYGKLGSQDILSAHINGLQFGINNLETALNLQTTVSTETLVAVTDMDDTTLRYRIYEATNRNWLTSPAPVIKRNGTVVSASEYVIQPAYGVVVFNVQQAGTDVITADVTYVNSTSSRLSTIETNIASNTSAVSANTSSISSLSGRVTTLEGGASTVASGYYPASTTLLNADVQSLYLNTVIGGAGSTAGAVASTNITMASNTIDAFPVFIDAPMTFDRMRVTVGTSSVSANIILGIYTNANMQPAQLVAQTALTAITSASGVQTLNLTSAVTLSEGLYWFVRYQSAGAKFDGFTYNTTNFLKIQSSTTANNNTTGATTPTNLLGIRTGTLSTLSALPSAFPAVGSGASDSKYLARDTFGVVYGIRK